MPPADPFGMTGQVLDGQFRIDQFVGEGGFSIVYKGTHVGLSEPIAIKCLKLPTALGSALVESFVKRFRDESRLHYKLSQGNLHIVRSIASGTTFAPTTSALVPYTVLEWLEGRSLADEFTDRRSRGLRGRPLHEAIKLLDSAVDAVAFAHAQGVVHRDLNPGNLFLARTASGTKLKVLDFGVAKILADSTLAMGPSARTLGNVRMFAPAYGAPEQFDERIGAVGPWTDVYALSLVLLEVLTDRTVMEGEHLGEFAMKALDAHQRPTPRALGIAVGDEVEALVARALAIAPTERPRDAGELWGMLKHAIRADEQSGVPPHARHADSPEPDAPNTLRMPERMSTGQSPVVEIVRPASSPPVSPAIPGARSSLPGGASSPGLATTLRADQASALRAGHGSTLRMARSPKSGAEALAATPGPPPAYTPVPAPSPLAAGVAPTGPMHAMTPPPPAAPSLGPLPQHTPLPSFSNAPPSAIFLRSGQGETQQQRRGRTPWALLLVLFVVVFGLLAVGVWLIGYGGHR